MSETPIELTQLELRQAEVAQYQQNIAMYEAIAAGLPSEYPEHLAQYKSRKDQHAAIADIEDMADVELLSDLWTYDSAKASVRSETVEMRKAIAIMNVLENQA